MQIRMQDGEGLTAEQIKEFLKGNEGVSFAGQSQKEVYGWVQGVLVAQEFTQQDKKRRGAIRAYVEKVTGLGSAQVTRLVRRFKETGIVEASGYHRRRFPRKYTDRDIALLAEVDRAHERLSGPATRHILEREHARSGQAEYARLAQISIGHLYNLRASAAYRKRAVSEISAATAEISQTLALPAPLRIGAGVNTGPAILGPTDYTALGDTVNAAFRLETATKGIGLGVALGERTYSELAVAARNAFVRRDVTLKGYDGSSIAWAISFEDLQEMLRR